MGCWLLAGCLASCGPAIAQNTPSSGADSEADQPYRDQLIDPDVEPLPPLHTLERGDEGQPWIFGIDYQFGMREMGDDQATEHGALIHYQVDTTNFGTIRFNATALDADSDTGFLDSGTSGHFTLSQTDMPLGDGWFADNALGVQRSVSSDLVTSSYRLYLPTTLLNGLSTRIRNDDEEWRFTWGRTGRLQGLYTRAFDGDDAWLTGAGYSRRMDDEWEFAAEFWHSSPADADDVSNAVAALGRGDVSESDSDQLHLLGDDDGDLGVWYDGERRTGLWRHRFGTLSLAEDLEWQNRPILNNRDAVYYRGDYETLRGRYTIGLDAGRSREDDLRDFRLFVGGDRRLGSFHRIGAQLSAGRRDLISGEFGDGGEQRDWQANVYYNQELDWFDQRLELTTQRSEGGFDSTSHRLSLDQFWNLDGFEGMTTRLELEESDRESGADTRTARAGITYRHRFTNRVSLDTSLLAVHEDSAFGSQTTANASLAVNWPISDRWSVGLNAIYNEIPQFGFAARPGDDGVMQGRQVFLRLSYGDSGGRRQGVMGAGSSDQGIGRINGVVYLDENGDGRRSPGESGVEGVVVRLDAVATTITDSQGRFEFWPVAAGNHRLEVGVESVPLPWAPAASPIVNVDPRGETFEDLPLQRINE